MLLLLCTVCAMHSKVYIVSAGIADYPGTRNDLRISDNDAKVVAKLFTLTKDAETSILTNEKATKYALLNAMRSTFADAKTTDTVILFFSGHGVPGALMCYDGELSYQSIFKVFKECKASKKIIFADACFSGKMRSAKQQKPNYNTQSVMLFLSSRTSEMSQETQYKNSLFTIFLERGLRGGADKNRDRTITAKELYDFVHEGVSEASQGRQHPVMWGKFDNNMTVIKW